MWHVTHEWAYFNENDSARKASWNPAGVESVHWKLAHIDPSSHLSGTADPTWGDIFESCLKAQSSKLEPLFCHVLVRRYVRALSFELWKSFENVTPRGISCTNRENLRLYFGVHCTNQRDWWSWPMGVKAKGMLRVCQGESSNLRIP